MFHNDYADMEQLFVRLAVMTSSVKSVISLAYGLSEMNNTFSGYFV